MQRLAELLPKRRAFGKRTDRAVRSDGGQRCLFRHLLTGDGRLLRIGVRPTSVFFTTTGGIHLG